MRSEHLVLPLMVVITISCFFVLTSWDKMFNKNISTSVEPEDCLICDRENGGRHHAPVLINLSTGAIWELKIYDNDPIVPLEVAAKQSWSNWVFTLLDENAVMTWNSEDHTNMATIGNNNDEFNPAHFCHNCREILSATGINGYAILDLYNLEYIQAFALEDGAKYTIRDYTVAIHQNETGDCLIVETVGHLFGTQ